MAAHVDAAMIIIVVVVVVVGSDCTHTSTFTVSQSAVNPSSFPLPYYYCSIGQMRISTWHQRLAVHSRFYYCCCSTAAKANDEASGRSVSCILEVGIGIGDGLPLALLMGSEASDFLLLLYTAPFYCLLLLILLLLLVIVIDD